jgi:hypothetical protein
MKGYRTIIWNIANALVPVMDAIWLQGMIRDEWLPYWLAVYIVGNIILRLKTTTPVGKSNGV